MNGLRYLGPQKLTQYYIESYTMKYETKGKLKNHIVVVEIVFKRTVLNDMLTTIMPSACVCIVSFSTNFYKVRKF